MASVASHFVSATRAGPSLQSLLSGTSRMTKPLISVHSAEPRCRRDPGALQRPAPWRPPGRPLTHPRSPRGGRACRLTHPALPGLWRPSAPASPGRASAPRGQRRPSHRCVVLCVCLFVWMRSVPVAGGGVRGGDHGWVAVCALSCSCLFWGAGPLCPVLRSANHSAVTTSSIINDISVTAVTAGALRRRYWSGSGLLLSCMSHGVCEFRRHVLDILRHEHLCPSFMAGSRAPLSSI